MDGNTFTTLSVADQERFGLSIVVDRLKRYEAARARYGAWQIDITSRLAEDNAATILYKTMAEELGHLMASALDHLEAVNGFLKSDEMPPFAPFTLIRSAIECCAYGIWVQRSPRADKRIYRLMTFQWDQRANVDTHTKASKTHTEALTKWFYDLLTYTKDQKHAYRQSPIKEMPSISNVLAETDKIVEDKGGVGGLGAWRICSGVAHGNQQFTAGLMRSTPTVLSDGTNGTSNSVSLASLAMVIIPAIGYLEMFTDLLLDNSEPRKGASQPKLISGGPPRPQLAR